MKLLASLKRKVLERFLKAHLLGGRGQGRVGDLNV